MPDPAVHYSEGSFRSKLRACAARAGGELIEKALTLFYCLQDEDTPAWARSTIAAALGYFIWPADAIADAVPAMGLTDDLGVLAMALATVAAHVKPSHADRARERMRGWIGKDRKPVEDE